MTAKQVEQPMELYLSSQKVRGLQILSEDTIKYLTGPGTRCTAYEFVQESESYHEFLRLFSTWLHEHYQVGGHMEYYLLMWLRMGEHLSPEEFEFLERNVAECFASTHGWYYEVNHRIRHRYRITLIMSQQMKFRRLIKKPLPGE